MPLEIMSATLNHLLTQGSELALIDVREHGEHNTAHIPGASLMPRRQLEFRMQRLVPCHGVQVVVYDDNGRRATLAAKTLEQMGYTRVAVLTGGLNRWSVEGYPTEWGLNVPSKDFGERVEVQHHVPTIEALELERRQHQGEKLVILDTRTPEEYGRFCIPGGRSVPGGELALRITDIVREQPDATVVVNCAGRTRSIIGARVLQRMGVERVVSLKNGTSGWLLAGLELERGASRPDLPETSPQGRAAAEAYAARLAAEDGVRSLNVNALRSLMLRTDQECVYLIDVRTEQEFAADHIPGFWWFPGGQVVQRSDDAVADRAATIVFACDGAVRSTVAASWYRQMGFANVFTVEGGVSAWRQAGLELETGMAEVEPFGLQEAAEQVRALQPAALQAALEGPRPPLLLFVDPSNDFAAGHVPAAHWLPRGWLETRIDEPAPDTRVPIVVMDRAGPQALLAAATLRGMGYAEVSALSGGTDAWRRAGLPFEQGLSGVMQPPDDVVAFGPDRGYADMIHYLRWEEDLGHKYARLRSRRDADARADAECDDR